MGFVGGFRSDLPSGGVVGHRFHGEGDPDLVCHARQAVLPTARLALWPGVDTPLYLDGRVALPRLDPARVRFRTVGGFRVVRGAMVFERPVDASVLRLAQTMGRIRRHCADVVSDPRHDPRFYEVGWFRRLLMAAVCGLGDFCFGIELRDREVELNGKANFSSHI